MQYDFHVPDFLFDREELERRRDNKQASEKFVIPLQTFWRPVELPGREYFEADLAHPDFQRQVNPMPKVESTIGQYLAKPLRDAILKNNREQIERLREGGQETGLRPHSTVELPETIVFDKFASQGQ